MTISDLEAIGLGIDRPEQVLVTRDGRVFASDRSSAIAEVLPNGGLRRMGRAGGKPNGIALNSKGKFLIANFGLGLLQELDPATGDIRHLITGSKIGRALDWINYVLVDSQDTMWVSVCSESSDFNHTIAYGVADGYLLRLAVGESMAKVVADGVNFPNCMALDADETYLYVVRTTKADVVRYRINGERLGPEEPFGPALAQRRSDEYGERAESMMGHPETMRRWGFADGCAFDGAGNLWVTLMYANRIVAIAPDESVATVAEDLDGSIIREPTSVAWGGSDMRDVYIGSLSAPYIVKGRSSVPGMPMVHQRP